jgi:hypothetical protein
MITFAGREAISEMVKDNPLLFDSLGRSIVFGDLLKVVTTDGSGYLGTLDWDRDSLQFSLLVRNPSLSDWFLPLNSDDIETVHRINTDKVIGFGERYKLQELFVFTEKHNYVLSDHGEDRAGERIIVIKNETDQTMASFILLESGDFKCVMVKREVSRSGKDESL